MTTKIMVEIDGSDEVKVTVSRPDSEPMEHLVKGHGPIAASVPRKPQRKEFIVPENGSVTIVAAAV